MDTAPEEKKPKVGRPPKDDSRLEKIEATLGKLTDVLSGIVESLPKKEQKPAAMNPVQVEKMKEEVKTMVVPPSWRALVDEYLGVDFETILQESAGGNFSMLVRFPKHIDRRIGTQRDPNKPDETMFSPIRLSSTTEDIKRWCILTVQNIKQTPEYNKFTPKSV